MKKFGYNVRIGRYCNHSEQAEEIYGSWSESYSNTFESISKCNDDFPDVTSIHNFSNGDIVYLVWIEWGSGDSVGHANGSNTESIGLFKTYEDAESLAKNIRKHDDVDNDNKFNWTSKEGEVVEYGFAPWFGYFESLDSINVESVTIGSGSRNRY